MFNTNLVYLKKIYFMKTCKKCNIEKDLNQFAKTNQRKLGVDNICRLCRNILQIEYRRKTNNIATKKYEKTKRGFLTRLYRNMVSRISGVQKAKYHLYKGKTILDKTLFYEWALNNETFHLLFNEYEKQNYDRKLAPSVDRIDSEGGYFIGNMEFVTHSENSRRGAIKKKLIYESTKEI